MAVIARARPLPLARHRAHAHGLRGGHAVGQRVRALRSRALLLGRHRRAGTRHVVVRHELWCAPCNLIRKPPAECAGPEPPECLRLVGVDAVYAQRALLAVAARRGASGARVKTLVFWGRRRGPRAARAGRGGALRALERRGARSARPDADAADEAAMAWTKELGPPAAARRPQLPRAARLEGRLALVVRGAVPPPLDARRPRYVRTIETLRRAARARAAGRGRGGRASRRGRGPARRAHLRRARRAVPRAGARARRGAAHARGRPGRAALEHREDRRSARSRPRSRGPRPRRRARTAADRCSSCPTPRSGASARDPATTEPEAYEHYFDRLIPEVARRDRPAAPSWWRWARARAFRRRGRARPARATGCACGADAGPYVARRTATRRGRVLARASGRATRAGPRALARAAREPRACARPSRHRGVPFADLAEADLAGTLLLQLPWAVRSYEEMAAVLARVRPAAVCLYAESSGWGRAALAACRAAGVPTVAIQHGIVYPKYYSYRHDAGRGGLPAARPHRGVRRGRAPAAGRAGRLRAREPRASRAARSSTSCWSARARGTATRCARAAGRRRRRAAGRGGQPLPRHPRHAPRHRQRVRRPGRARWRRSARRVPREAASRGVGAATTRPSCGELGARRVALSLRRADLLDLLHAADALVTVESLSAVEALVLGRPVVILNMPTQPARAGGRGRGPGRARGRRPDGRRCGAPCSTRRRARRAATRARAPTSPSWRWASTAAPPRRIVALLRERGAPGRRPW